MSEFLQMYLPQNRVRGVSHDGYHVGLFSQMLGLMPEHWADSGRKTVVITVNMRSFGPSAMFNGNEASNQQEAIFYSHRTALLNRVYVSLHHYDNRDSREMERAKTQWFRTRNLRIGGGAGQHYGSTHGGRGLESAGEKWFYHNTVKWWLRDLQRQYAPVSGEADLARVMPMAEAYLKEFAFLLPWVILGRVVDKVSKMHSFTGGWSFVRASLVYGLGSFQVLDHQSQIGLLMAMRYKPAKAHAKPSGKVMSGVSLLSMQRQMRRRVVL